MNFFDLNNEDFDQNRASIILEEQLKPEPEHHEHHSNLKGNDLIDDLITATADWIENMIKDIIREIKEKQERAEREELAKQLKEEAEKFLSEAKNIADLERRIAAVEKVYKTLDKHYQHSKEDRTHERLDINSKLEIMSKMKEKCSEITFKNEPIKFYSRVEFLDEMKRVKSLESSLNLNLSNAELINRISNASDNMNRELEQTTNKMRGLYEKSPDWQSHEQRDTTKYYYSEPPHSFSGKGIPKESPTGKAITEQVKTRNELQNEIARNQETIKALKTISPDHQHQISYQAGEDLHKVIRDHAEKAPKAHDLSKERSHDHGRSR